MDHNGTVGAYNTEALYNQHNSTHSTDERQECPPLEPDPQTVRTARAVL